MSRFLEVLSRNAVGNLMTTRVGELKIGETITLANQIDWTESIRFVGPKYVLLGIPEDIGVRANNGIGGTHTAWPVALKAILNIQSTPSFTGDELLILGAFNFSEWMEKSVGMNIEELRDLVIKIDEQVSEVIRFLIHKEKIPIIIGGGHNNAYGLLKGASLAHKQKINCINLDAHSDFRRMEGRHSGNGFRYAKEENYLNKYAIIGLHENYSGEVVINDLNAEKDIQYSFFEDIFIRNAITYEQALQQAQNHVKGSYTGIELDLDCIQNVLSSAATPVGISSLQARQYIHFCAQNTNACYLHLTEGATRLSDGREDNSTGKLIAYLVSDFIKGRKQ